LGRSVKKPVWPQKGRGKKIRANRNSPLLNHI
jgi:hypothetical protein